MTAIRGMKRRRIALNAICPYFTMFPLDFPHSVLASRARSGECVLDPFCGRGTTNFAARLLGLPTIGIDTDLVAMAATEAKLVAPKAGSGRHCSCGARGAAKCRLYVNFQKVSFGRLAYRGEVLDAALSPSRRFARWRPHTRTDRIARADSRCAAWSTTT